MVCVFLRCVPWTWCGGVVVCTCLCVRNETKKMVAGRKKNGGGPSLAKPLKYIVRRHPRRQGEQETGWDQPATGGTQQWSPLMGRFFSPLQGGKRTAFQRQFNKKGKKGPSSFLCSFYTVFGWYVVFFGIAVCQKNLSY